MKKRSIISDNIEESQKTDFRFSMKLQKISTSTMCYHTRIELHVLTNHRLSISFGHSKQMELKEIWSCQGLNVMLFITKVCIYIQYISTNEIGWSPSWLVGWCVGKKKLCQLPHISDRLQWKFVPLKAMKCRCKGHTVFLRYSQSNKDYVSLNQYSCCGAYLTFSNLQWCL